MSRAPTAYERRVADRASDDNAVERSLVCIASGCPNRWTVDGGNGRLCSAHAWVDPHTWPIVTREQQDAETDRARAFAWDEHHPAAAPISSAEKIALAQRLRTVLQELKRPRAWLERLRAKQRDGEALSAMQRHCVAEADRNLSSFGAAE